MLNCPTVQYYDLSSPVFQTNIFIWTGKKVTTPNASSFLSQTQFSGETKKGYYSTVYLGQQEFIYFHIWRILNPQLLGPKTKHCHLHFLPTWIVIKTFQDIRIHVPHPQGVTYFNMGKWKLTLNLKHSREGISTIHSTAYSDTSQPSFVKPCYLLHHILVKIVSVSSHDRRNSFSHNDSHS